MNEYDSMQATKVIVRFLIVAFCVCVSSASVYCATGDGWLCGATFFGLWAIIWGTD